MSEDPAEYDGDLEVHRQKEDAAIAAEETREAELPALIPRPDYSVAHQLMEIGQFVDYRAKVSTFIAKQLRNEVDFGRVPGCKKPSLWQPGAQKLSFLFNLTPTFAVMDQTRTPNSDPEKCYFEYAVKCQLFNRDGQLVGEGLGACNTLEAHYTTRYEEDDWAVKDNKARAGELKQHPATLANTCLKMASKRAFVCAVLNVAGGGVSEHFTQDMEDIHRDTHDGWKELASKWPGKCQGPDCKVEIPEGGILWWNRETKARICPKCMDAGNFPGEKAPSPAAKPKAEEKAHEWKFMRARKAGKCAICQKAMGVGDDIFWLAGTNTARHSACHAERERNTGEGEAPPKAPLPDSPPPVNSGQPNAWRAVKAKAAGECPKCKSKWAQGEGIYSNPATNELICASCFGVMLEGREPGEDG